MPNPASDLWSILDCAFETDGDGVQVRNLLTALMFAGSAIPSTAQIQQREELDPILVVSLVTCD
jgi:hypothetical protein